MNMSKLLGSAMFAAVAIASTNAEATTWWRRTPGTACVGTYAGTIWPGASVRVDGWTGGILFNGGTNTVTPYGAECPFVDSEASNDDTVTGIVVDIFDHDGAGVTAGTVIAEACTFSSWTDSCGGFTGNSTISPYGHGSINISSLTAWTGDSGLGYAYVWLGAYGSTSGNVATEIVGTYIHN